MRSKMLILMALFALLLSACNGVFDFNPPPIPSDLPSVPPTATPNLVPDVPTLPPPTETASPLPPMETAVPTTAVPPTETAAAPAADNPHIRQFQMFSETDGWAISDSHLLRTKDGGQSWQAVTQPNAFNLSQARAYFLDMDNAWLLAPDPGTYDSGQLVQVSGGGAFWFNSAVPFAGGSMAFIDPKYGWMLADRGVGAGSNAVSVFITTQGGTQWGQVFTNDPTLSDSSDTLPLGGLKSGIAPVDASVAFVGGVTYADGVLYLYRTEDQGFTWSPVEVSLPAELQNAQLAGETPVFVTPTDGWYLLHVNSPTLPNAATALLITHDGGQSWQFAPNLLPASSHFSAVDASTFVISTSDAKFLRTTNGGQSWEPIAPNLDFSSNLLSIQFVGPSMGWALTYDEANTSQLYRTTDGGQTWVPLTSQ